MDMEETKKDFRDRFSEMRMLGYKVHKMIIKSRLNSVAYNKYDLDGMIYWNSRANPLDFMAFRSWMLNYEGKCDKEIREIYEKIVNRVLADGGSLDMCFRELLRCCEPYVINLLEEGCYHHNKYVFRDYVDLEDDNDDDSLCDVIEIFKDSEYTSQDETSAFSVFGTVKFLITSVYDFFGKIRNFI